MQTDILIVGKGICGTLLSWQLHKEGKSFVVIDDAAPDSSSKIAAGIINPVTGRRYVYSWMIDTVMPFAVDAYKELEKYLEIDLIQPKSIIDFFPSAQMRDAFVTRITEDDTFVHTYPDQNHFNQFFNYEFGCGEVRPAYIVHLSPLLAAWRKKLKAIDCLQEETFHAAELTLTKDGIQYGSITAQHIIFCDGIQAAKSPWFAPLPFSPNKGEVLIVQSDALTNEHIFKKGLMLAPTAEKGTYWVGSNYQWSFGDENPSDAFYKSTKAHLEQWLKAPFQIIDHKAAVRPATLERRPFVGFHPVYNNIGILNGMGTKGTSLAPFFAHQLVQQMIHNFPIEPQADVKRFSRTLTKLSA